MEEEQLMIAKEKTAGRHLGILELAQAIDNIREAYPLWGMTRTQYYDRWRRF